MALQFVGSTSAEGYNNGWTASLTGLTGGIGSAPIAGDLVIVNYVRTSGSNADLSINTSGYTEISDLYADDTIDCNQGTYWKIMTSTPDTSVAMVGSGGDSEPEAVTIHVWRGADPLCPLDATSTTATGINSSLANAPSINTATPHAVVLALMGGAGGPSDTANTGPSGMTNYIQRIYPTGGARSVKSAIASLERQYAGAYDPAALTGGTDATTHAWCATTVAIRPLMDKPRFVGGTAYASAPGGGGGNITMPLTSLTNGCGTAPAEGDVVVVVLSVPDVSTNFNLGVSGYTEVADIWSSSGSVAANVFVGYKVMTASPDTGITYLAPGNGAAMSAHVWRGIDTTTPIDVTTLTASGTANVNWNSPEIRPTTYGAVIISAGGASNPTSTITAQTAPSNMGNFFTANTGVSYNASAGISSTIWDSTGPFDPAAVGGGPGGGGAAWGGASVVLRPKQATLARYQQILTGTQEWVAPAGVTKVFVEAWGGGGAGGDGNTAGAEGGGGGAYAAKVVNVTPGNSYTVTIGNGGTPPSLGGAGGAGGDTSFESDVIAKGGTGGLGGGSTGGGLGGQASASTGDIKNNGGDGGDGGGATNDTGGGGGGAGGPHGAGNNGSNGTTIGGNGGSGDAGLGGTAGTGGSATFGGAGGASVLGGGGGGGGDDGNRGGVGGSPGGGGGGADSANSGSAGGGGAAGQVRLSYVLGAVPVFVGYATASGNNADFYLSLTSLVGGIDTQARADDYVVVCASRSSSTDMTDGIDTTASPGWTEITDLYANDAVDTNHFVYGKRMGASPDTQVLIKGTGDFNLASAAVAQVFRYVDADTPVDVASTTATGIDSSTVTPPSITPVTPGAVVLSCGSNGQYPTLDSSFDVSTGYINKTVSYYQGVNNSALVAVAHKFWDGLGTEIPSAWTNVTNNANDSWAATTLVLRGQSTVFNQQPAFYF